MSELDKYQSGEAPAPESVPPGVIVSPDTQRENRVPAGQSRTRKWPILQYGAVPQISLSNWTFTLDGLVQRPQTWTWTEFQQLPRIEVFSDFHCVTRWSRLGNLWSGVSVRWLLEQAGIDARAQFAIATGADDHWTTNMPLADLLRDDVLLADRHDGEPLSADHGGPVRLIVPQLYAWKSAKWLTRLSLREEDLPGVWEQVGYHLRGDPWTVSSQHPDGERFREDWPADQRRDL